MSASVGFLKAFWKSCSGTEIFEELKEQSWLRIIWHTILISLLAAMIATCAQGYRFAPELEHQKQAFCSLFGDRLTFSEDQVLPEEAPEKNRLLPLPYDTLLVYVGTGETGAELPEKELPLVQNLVIWSAADFASAQQISPGEWLFGKCSLHDGKTRPVGSMEQIRSSELVRRIRNFHQKNSFFHKVANEESTFTVSVGVLTKIIFWLTCGAFFLFRFAEFLFSQWFFTTLYAGVMALFVVRRLRRLTLRQCWKIGMYAGFPALAVGLCWPVLDLPFLDFQLVYTIGLIFYWMAVIGRLENRPDTPDNDQGGTAHES